MLQDVLTRQLQTKGKLRDDIKQQLDKQTTSFDRVEKDAQALLHKALHAGRKITVQHAQHKQTKLHLMSIGRTAEHAILLLEHHRPYVHSTLYPIFLHVALCLCIQAGHDARQNWLLFLMQR